MDLVSNLPEEVLCHILSFLTTKEAALTSVLSKKWLTLWTLVPNLDIDDSVFLHPEEEEEEGKRERDGTVQSFMDFVDRALALQRDTPIKRFSLKCKTGIDPDRVNLWIRNVLKRGVSDLELVLDFPRSVSDDDDDDEYYQLPWEMFESKTLVNLKLKSEFGVDWWREKGTFLPMLKSLSIKELFYLPDDLGVFVTTALPVVEELYMSPMEWYWDETVSSASLRKLTLYANGFADFDDPKSISLDTPSLVYLDYSDYVAADYPIVNLTNLVEARLNLLVIEDQLQLIRAASNGDEEEAVVIQRFRNVSKVMSGLRNVQKLSLTADTLEVLSLSCDSMPVFNSLKFLNIKSHKERGWRAVPVLLRNCPHLETLVFEGLIHYVTDDCGDACGCVSREDKGRSLVSCPVKKIEIRGFEITVPEMKTIRLLLESLPCLKEMKIYAEDDDDGDGDPISLELLRGYKSIEMAMKYYSQLFKCDVSFIRPGSL